MKGPIDWRVLGIYAFLVAMTPWIPVPIVDGLIANYLRRAQLRAIADRHETKLDSEAIRILADDPGGGCLGFLIALLLWPFKKIFKTIFTFLHFKEIADLGSDAAHRGLLLEEAFAQGWLPGDPIRVREAMDKAVERIEIRLVERQLRGVFRKEERDWQTRIAPGNRPLQDETPARTAAEAAQAGIVAELIHAFRDEMAPGPKEAVALLGPLTPEVLPADPTDLAGPPPKPPVEEAEEIRAIPEVTQKDETEERETEEKAKE